MSFFSKNTGLTPKQLRQRRYYHRKKESAAAAAAEVPGDSEAAVIEFPANLAPAAACAPLGNRGNHWPDGGSEHGGGEEPGDAGGEGGRPVVDDAQDPHSAVIGASTSQMAAVVHRRNLTAVRERTPSASSSSSSCPELQLSSESESGSESRRDLGGTNDPNISSSQQSQELRFQLSRLQATRDRREISRSPEPLLGHSSDSDSGDESVIRHFVAPLENSSQETNLSPRQCSRSAETVIPEARLDPGSGTTDGVSFDPEEAFAELSREFSAMRAHHGITHAGAEACWRFAFDNCNVIRSLTEATDRGLSYRSSRREAESDLPPVQITVLHQDRLTGEIHKFTGDSFPRKQFSDEKFQLLLECSKIAVKDIVALHTQIHAASGLPRHFQVESVDISYDGVPESHSGPSIEIFTMQFPPCRNVYHVQVHKPQQGFSLDLFQIWADIVSEIRNCELSVNLLKCDAPMRLKLKGMKGTNAKFACDLCEDSAVVFREGGETGDGNVPVSRRIQRLRYVGDQTARGKLYWPLKNDQAMLRTDAEIRRLQARVNELCESDLKGVCARSPLLDLNIDMIKDVPVDPMHQIFKGIVAMFLQLTFNIGAARPRLEGKPGRLPVNELNQVLKALQSPKEFSRHTRNLDERSLKAEELKYLLLAWFPTVAYHIPHDRPEHEMWILMAYLVRACIFPADNGVIAPEDQRDGHDRFYALFQEQFGPRNLTYNVHMFSHLPLIRERGLLSELSCFDAESSYAVYRDRYRAGTTSTAKQALLSAYLRHSNGSHSCRLSLTLSPKRPGRRNDSFLYTQNFSFYEVQEEPQKGSRRIQCRRVLTRQYVAGYGTDMAKVGVFVYCGLEDAKVWITTDSVLGKAVIAPFGPQNHFTIVALPKNVLEEGHV